MQDTAVLIIHGIQGHSRLLKWLEDGLGGRAAVYNLLLPGHGQDVRAFLKADMRMWQEFVDARALELRRRYRRVIYVGHSMGCLLGLSAAMAHPGIFDGMILLACPLRVRMTWRYIKYNFLAALRREGGDAFVQAARLGNGVHPKSPLEYLLCGRQFAQLLVKVRRVRREIKDPGIPLLAFQPELDEIVSPRSLEGFREMENARTAMLPGCGHNYYTDAAKAEILAKTREML
ncbi:MAG: alpha/beta fold hydrolase [Clostridia bacterium]|nr:alpha/beta fold hydrolase [Clostridia bacterium]